MSFYTLLIAGKDYYTVDSSKCIGCQLCVKVCPVNAISMKDGKAVIDIDKCINCGICEKGNGKNYRGCPVSAISQKKAESAVKKVYQVIKDKCIGCQLCVKPCPVKAIKMKDGRAVIDVDKCINCGICDNGNGNDFKGCPVDAIEPTEIKSK